VRGVTFQILQNQSRKGCHGVLILSMTDDGCYRLGKSHFVSEKCDHKESSFSFVHPRKGGGSGEEPLKKYSRAICLRSNDVAVTDATLMRAIAIQFGPTLISLCLSNCRYLTNDIVEKLCIHLECLRNIDLSNCPNIGDAVGRTCSDCCGKSLMSVRLNGCNLISNEVLLWISGRHGIKCANLHSIDVSGNHHICSKGLEALGRSCRTLHHLNVAFCADVGNRGISAIAHGCAQLRSLVMSNCTKISDGAVSIVCKRCKLLECLNLANCKHLTDSSVRFIATLSRLKTLHMEGIDKVNEECLYDLGEGCRNLIYLNLTGCSKITRCGLLALIAGFGFVKEATDFFGFIPEDHVRVHSIGRYRRQAKVKGCIISSASRKRDLATKGHYECINAYDQAAARIQWVFMDYLRRQRYLDISSHKEQIRAAVKIEKYVRRWLELRRLPLRIGLQKEQNESVISIQKIVRGYLTRVADEVVWCAIHVLRERRIASSAAILLQCHIRQLVAKNKHHDLIMERRSCNRCAVIIQIFFHRAMMGMWCRSFIDGKIEESMQMSQASFCVGRLYRRRVCREKGKLLLSQLRLASNAAICIQSIARMLLSQNYFRKRLDEHQMKTSAAILVQRIFRGFFARRNRLCFVASFVQHRQLEEHNSGIANAIRRYSVEDQKPGDHIQNGDYALEGLVGAYCQVFWPLNNAFIGGQICGLNEHQNMCKIVYADGDYEWLDLTNDSERLIVYNRPFNQLQP